MTSNVKPEYPQEGRAYTANVRENFSIIKEELEALEISTNPVTLLGIPDYITISNQEITRHLIDLDEHVTGQNTAFNKDFGTVEDTVCEGDDSRLSEYLNRVRWKNVQIVGDTYEVNDMAQLDGWVGIANTQTTEPLSPQTYGDEVYLYNGSSLATQSDTVNQLVFGIDYVADLSGYIKSYRVNTVIGNHYGIILIKDPSGINEVTFVNSFVADVNGWREFTLNPRFIVSGAHFRILAIVHEPDPTPTIISANYDYVTPNNVTVPTAGQCVHADKELGVLSIHNTDSDTIDRSALLLSLLPGDFISISVGGTEQISWAIQAVEDKIDYVDFTIAPQAQLGTNGTYQLDFSTVAAAAVNYVREDSYWTGISNISGVFVLDDSWENVVLNNHAYGIDLLVQAAAVSSDWDLLPQGGSGTGLPVVTDHNQLSNIGVNTHYQIDTHIADTDAHTWTDGAVITDWGLTEATEGGSGVAFTWDLDNGHVCEITLTEDATITISSTEGHSNTEGRLILHTAGFTPIFSWSGVTLYQPYGDLDWSISGVYSVAISKVGSNAYITEQLMIAYP